MKPTFFATPSEFRTWLERHHDSADELFVGFMKKGTRKPSITWPESVDQALCFGWIDGVRRTIDDGSYVIRFTPRRPGSRWSTVNLRRCAALEAAGLMAPAGRKALAARSTARSGTYSYEQDRPTKLDAALSASLRSNAKACSFLAAQAPSYQRKVVHWVMAAKGVEVRRRRLDRLIAAFEKGVKL